MATNSTTDRTNKVTTWWNKFWKKPEVEMAGVNTHARTDSQTTKETSWLNKPILYVIPAARHRLLTTFCILPYRPTWHFVGIYTYQIIAPAILQLPQPARPPVCFKSSPPVQSLPSTNQRINPQKPSKNPQKPPKNPPKSPSNQPAQRANHRSRNHRQNTGIGTVRPYQ